MEATPYISLWPQPRNANYSGGSCALTARFRIEYSSSDKSLVESTHESRLLKAITRTNAKIESLINRSHFSVPECRVQACSVLVEDVLRGFSREVRSEGYVLRFDGSEGCSISCSRVYGCMHGFSTFIFIVDPMKSNGIPSRIEIDDEPQLPHRGLMIDTARRFLPVSLIKEHLDVMSMVKMNVLHWHIVDDHSFPLHLKSFPELSAMGAYSSRAIYSPSQIREIIEYAASRGILVVPEIDIPGHTESWMKSHPELQGDAQGAIDPTRDETYDFLKTILKEVKSLFSTDVFETSRPRIHLGGDETWNAWDTPGIKRWMHDHGMDSKGDMVSYWLDRLDEVANDIGIEIMLWEDFLADQHKQRLGVTWQFWQSHLNNTGISLGQPVVYSTQFYLDHLDLRWEELYAVNMTAAASNVVGGEACMWGEYVDRSNHFQRVWPRTAAVAERLWCGDKCSLDPSQTASARLSKWRCRMVEFMGYPHIEPVGQTPVAQPDQDWTWHTDKEQWYCGEHDLEYSTFLVQQV